MGRRERLEAHDASVESTISNLARELARVRPDIENKIDTERVECSLELPRIALCRRAASKIPKKTSNVFSKIAHCAAISANRRQRFTRSDVESTSDALRNH
jgi:hypothetical protein